MAAPTVTTDVTLLITPRTAKGYGNITDLGDSAVTQHGHCWATATNPTTDSDKTENGAAAATGIFSSNISGLVGGTLYYLRAYATNTTGTSYGDNVTFTTIGSEVAGAACIVQTYFFYVDAYGTQRYIQGGLVT